MKELKNRLELAEYFAEQGYLKGAEVGVFQGYYSKILLDTNKGLNLLCVDSWTTATGWGERRNKAAFPVALSKLSQYPNATILKGDSKDAAGYIIDEYLDFVYIDADHSYEAVKSDLQSWAPKVKKGGIVSGHDYFEHRTLEVIQAVDEYAKTHGYKVYSTPWDYDVPTDDDRQPNWYFEKI